MTKNKFRENAIPHIYKLNLHERFTCVVDFMSNRRYSVGQIFFEHSSPGKFNAAVKKIFVKEKSVALMSQNFKRKKM